MISITIDAKAFLASVRRARKQIAKGVYAAVRRAAELTAERASATGLFQDRTGGMRRGIHAEVLSDTSARAGTSAKQAAWVENGNGFRTGASRIYPKRHPFLVFRVDGQKVVARSVATSKPRPFMAEAARSVEPTFIELCREAVDNMFR